MKHENYENPLTSRYAGKEMIHNWSPLKKHSTWRRLWLALAEAEKELGLKITDSQLNEMRNFIDNINFDTAQQKEKELRHDVMSHIFAFGEQCPGAKPIIHLGATSCFVTDNTELIQIKDGLNIIKIKLAAVIAKFAKACEKYKDLPTLGFTHYQPAQLTTVGKRFSLYLQDFIYDLERLEAEFDKLPFRSVKGTTGTQASFLALFNGDHEKVKMLEGKIAVKMGFSRIIDVTGQTYTRKLDYFVLSVLSGIAQSANKFCNDVRLLANLKEIEEPFGSKQVGSSAMAYKRNPMRSERVCSISRYLMSLPDNTAQTHALQWFERTLDDSANRRIVLPQAFLAADAILILVANIIEGIQVWPKVIESHIRNELPFMATENIMMAAVKAGGDRQEIHEAVRAHSMAAGRVVKEGGKENDLLRRLKEDPLFAKIADQIDDLVEPKAFIGRASEQVTEFLENTVAPILTELAPELKEGNIDGPKV